MQKTEVQRGDCRSADFDSRSQYFILYVAFTFCILNFVF